MEKDKNVVDLLTTAQQRGDHLDTVVEVMRRHMRLSRVPISHAIGQDAEPWFKRNRGAPHTPEGDALWAATPTPAPSPSRYPVIPLEPDWMDDAACRTHPDAATENNPWFHDDPVVTPEQIEAVRVCTTECPRLGECAMESLNQYWLILAGMTDRTRRDFRRWVKMGVVPPEIPAIAALAADTAKASLAHRVTVVVPEPVPQHAHGRLFDIHTIGTVTATTPQRRRTTSWRRTGAVTVEMFPCDTGDVTREPLDPFAVGPLHAEPVLAAHG